MVTPLLMWLACGLAVPYLGDKPDGDSGVEDDSAADSGSDTSPPDDTSDTANNVETGDTASPETDGDGDGYLASEGDCDDTRANVYPGAPDGCDSLDQNCDGEPVPAGTCSEMVDVEAAASRVIVGDGSGSFSYAVPVGDVDGDGREDLWILNSSADHQAFSLVTGAEMARNGDEVDRDWYTVWDGYPEYQLTGRSTAGDYDGNGYDDIWLSAREYAPIGAVGGLYLFLGGPDRWLPGAEYGREATDGYWEAEFGGSYQVGDILGAGDLTGDGLDDALMRGTWDGDDTPWWALVEGTTDTPPFGASAADFPVWIDTHGEEFGVSYSTAYFAGDLDGDGNDELLVQHDYNVGTASGIVLIEGEDLATADGAWVGDLAKGFYYDDGSGDAYDAKVGVIPTGLPASDVDNDGLPNLAMFVRIGSAVGLDDSTCTLVLQSGLPAGNFAGTELARICTIDAPDDGTEAESYPIAWTQDVDGDSGAELMVSRQTGGWSYDYNTCVVRSSTIVGGGVIDVLAAENGVGPCYGLQYAWADTPLFVDMTGDGFSDLVHSDYDYDSPEFGDRAGRIVVVDGFDIPWDDPSKW